MANPTIEIPGGTSASGLAKAVLSAAGIVVTVQDAAAKGAANGYASLGAGGLVPIGQLASGTPDGTKFVRDDGTLAVPAAGISGVAIDNNGALVGTRPIVNLIAGANVTLTIADNAGANRVDVTVAATASAGGLPLLFDSTLGADATSIDTGANGIAQTSDHLIVLMLLRTDDAAAIAAANVTLNNDGGGNYDRVTFRNTNTTVAGVTSLAQTSWPVSAHGSGGGASYFAVVQMWIPCYKQTSAFKTATVSADLNDSTAANNRAERNGLTWKSTAAITRMAVAGQGAAKLKAGSRLAIYGV